MRLPRVPVLFSQVVNDLVLHTWFDWGRGITVQVDGGLFLLSGGRLPRRFGRSHTLTLLSDPSLVRRFLGKMFVILLTYLPNPEVWSTA